MPFIPNELDAFHPSQAAPDSGDLEILVAGEKATGVVSGGEVTAQGTPDMTVAVATGVIAVEGAKVNVAAGNVTITAADGTDPRIDLIVVSSAGAKSAVAGTPAPEMDPPTEAGPVFPTIPASSVVLAAVYVPAADTDIDANQITDKRVFVIPPQSTTNYDLAKARDIPLVKERSQTVTLASGRNQIHGSAMAGGKLFFTTRTSPAWFIRCNNLDDLTDRDDFQFAADGFHDTGDSCVYVAETDRIYVVFSHASRVCISEVNPSTHAVVDVINDTGRVSGTNPVICSDGTNLYVGTRTSPAKVLKYRLSDFAFVSEVALTKNTAHGILYDGTDIFLTGETTPAWVARVDPVAMTVSQEVDFPTGFGPVTDDLVSFGEYLWVGIELTAVPSIHRVEKANLTNQLKVGVANVVWAMHSDGESIWVGDSVGNIYRVAPFNLEIDKYVTGLANANEILSDGAGRLFLTSFESPSKVMRFIPAAPSERRVGLGTLIPVGGSIDTVLPMGKRFIDSVTRTTSGTSEATLGQMSVEANLLNVDGMMLRVTVSGSFAANANNKRIAIRLNSSNYMFDTGLLPFNDARWKFMLEIIRTGAATQDWTAFFISDSSILPTDVQFGTTTANLATLLFMAVRAQTPTAAGDVTQEHYMVEVLS